MAGREPAGREAAGPEAAGREPAGRRAAGAVAVDDRGSATLEFALAVPSVVLVLAVAVSGLAVAAQAVHLADAAAVVARQTARGDTGSVSATIAALAPGAVSSTTSDGGLVCVVLSRSVGLGPSSVTVPLTSRSCAPEAGR